MAKKALGLKLPITLGQDGYFQTNSLTAEQLSSNIQNLLSTIPGERRFNNTFGSSLYNLLFQMNDLEVSKEIVVDAVQRDIDKWVNGVIVNDVKVQLSNEQNYRGSINNDKNKIFISVVFTYNNATTQTDVTISNPRI
jgi:phage baseplate assembly protein W